MKFTIANSKTVVIPESLEHSEFKDILTKDNDLGNQVLLYIYLLCDISYENPLRDVPYTTKDKEALSVVFNDENFNIKLLGEEWSTLISKAIARYEKSVITDDERDIYAYDKKMDQFREMLLETTPRIEKNFGPNSISYTTNIEIINSVLEDIVMLIQTKASLVSMMVQGTIPKHLRGGLSPLSTGQINPLENDSKEKVSNVRSKQAGVEYPKKRNTRKTGNSRKDS